MFRIRAKTVHDRQHAIHAAEQAFSRAGGWVMGVRTFASNALNFQLEMSGRSLTQLPAALAAQGISVATDSAAMVSGLDARTLASEELAVTVVITLLGQGPDTPDDIPSVPG